MSTSKIAEWEAHVGEVVETKSGFDAIRCTQCGFIHVVPIPSVDALADFYRDKFYAQKPNYFEAHKRDQEWWSQLYSERYERFESHFGGKPGRLLDIGSGPGNFLKVGAKRGWDVVGLEPGEQAANYSRELGLNVVNDMLRPELVDDLGQFDVVYMHGVLEHMRSPTETADLMFKLVKPNGLCFVNVANDFNPFQVLMRENYGYPAWWLVPPEHINYFDVASLTALLKKMGFVEHHVTMSFPIDMFLLMGENYIGNDEIGKRCHEKRKSFESKLNDHKQNALLAQLYESFAKLNIGREIDLTVRKPR